MKGIALRGLLAAIALVLAACSVALYVRDVRARRPAEQFLSRFEITARRPAEAATVALVPAADLAADLVADIALSDAFGSYQLEATTPEIRERWLRAVESIDDEIVAARELTLDAAARRPGWPLHWALLGRLSYTWQYRHPLATTATDIPQWREPLRIGFLHAPGSDSTAVALASATLEKWPDLPERARAEASPLFGRALHDPEFAQSALPMIQMAIGRDRALALLPREARALSAAFTTLAERKDVASAVTIYRLWESTEWQSRLRDLEQLEERARLNDVEGMRRLSNEWLNTHAATDFDTPAGRRQLLRVLEITTNDREAMWQRDARGNALRFLLDHRMHPGRSRGSGIEIVAGGSAVGEAMSALEAVPDPMRARARLLAGDVFGAESLFQRSDSNGALEWTPFLVDLARFRIAQNMPDAARVALDNVARAARDECEVRLVRRELERRPATANEEGVHALSSNWSSNGQLSVCVDPETATHSYLTTTIDVESPALVSYGWNGGRRAAIQMPAGRIRASMPLAGQWGRNAFFLRTLAGGPITPVTSTIERQ